MKTVMQELLEEVIAEREGSTNVYFREALDFVKSAIEQDYLDKEKEQIGRAYQEGLIDGMNHSPKDYYNTTYNKQ